MLEGTKSSFTLLKRKIGLLPLVLISLMIIIILYFSISSRWIPAAKIINETDANNQTVEILAIYSYAEGKYIPRTNNFEYSNSQIPKGSFEMGGAFFLITLLIIFAVILSKKGKIEDLIPIEDIIKNAEKYLDYVRDVKGKISAYEIEIPNCKLQYKQVDEGASKPETWLLPVNITPINRVPERLIFGFHPYDSGHLKFSLTKKGIFSDVDCCSKCGTRYSDIKVLTPKGYTQWFEQFYKPTHG